MYIYSYFCMYLWTRRMKPWPVWNQEKNDMSTPLLFNRLWVYFSNNMTKRIFSFIKVTIVSAQIISFWYCITKSRIFRPFICLGGGLFLFFFPQNLYNLESLSRSSAVCLLSCLSENTEITLRGKRIRSSIWIILYCQFTSQYLWL